MNRPILAATAAPTRLARRLVLGTALLVGLAIALAPRTPAVLAQESKTPPVTAPKAQPTTKTVTISDGRGVEAKIEVKDTNDPAAKSATTGEPSAAADSPPAGSGAGGQRSANGRG